MADDETPGLEQEPERGTLERVEQIGTLFTIGGGGAAEQFQAELERVIENIGDPNTEAKDRRTIYMKFVFLPTADRSEVMVGIYTDAKMGATRPISDHMFIGKKDGKTVGVVMHPQFDQPVDPRQGVLSFERRQVKDNG